MDDSVHAVLSESAESPDVGAPDTHRVGAQGQCLEDVVAAAHAAVDHDGYATAHRAYDFRQGVDRRPQTVYRATTMVRHEDAVGAVLDGHLGILGRDDAFQADLHVAGVFEPLHIIPGIGGPLTGGPLQSGAHRPLIVRPMVVALLAELRVSTLAGQRASL